MEPTDAVAQQLSSADITSYATSAQGLIVGGLILLVAFRFLKRAF